MNKKAVVNIFLAAALLILPSALWSQRHNLTKPEGSPAPAAGSVRERADKLLAQMTVEEKAGQLNQGAGIGFQDFVKKASDDSIAKGEVGSILWLIDVKEINRLQHVAVDKSRLHIPLLFGFDVIHGYRTTFPVPLAMASSWDPSVEEQAQHVAAEDSRAAGIDWTFAPMLDIARDARWGRIVEGAGEDPYLGAAMARAQVRGFQGAELNSASLLACAKHFAGYGAAEGGRDYDSSYIPEVLLRNVYFPPFHAAVDQGVGSLMSAYMDLNDVPASGNRWLLHDVLREEWGFKGFVVTDAEAVKNLVTHGFAADRADAAYDAVHAGVNMDMASYTFIANVPNLVNSGKISKAQLDDAVRPILETKIRLGLFEHPYVDEAAVEPMLNRQSSRDLERKLAARSMVLLRNENQVLPLAKTVKSVALIGPLADNVADIEGGWTVEGLLGGGTKAHVVSVAEGLKDKLGPGVQITVVSGPVLTRTYPSAIDQLLGIKPPTPATPAELQKATDDAVAAAKQSDAVIAVMGEASNQNGEAASRATLDLPGNQEQMLEAIAATGKPIVLVLLNGRPLDIRWAAEHVPAILEAWYPGTVGGDAVADVLFADVNPGGKLPVSWPRAVGQEPLYYNHNLTHQPEDAPDFTSRYWDLSTKPLYPFGYGLSYSSFRFANLQLSKSQITPEDTTEVSVEVTNTSKTPGDAVAQIYIHQRSGSASRPVRQLKGFQRVALAAGESRTLKFQLGPAELRFWSPQTKKWAVEPSTFDVWAGEDSTATLHAEFSVKP
ncbi:MAG TPA: beta-glucosidase BglX [Candidatus Acidoferrales bacterium]